MKKIFPEFYIFIIILVAINLIGFVFGDSIGNILKHTQATSNICPSSTSPHLIFTYSASLVLDLLAIISNIAFFTKNRNYRKMGMHTKNIKLSHNVFGAIFCFAFAMLTFEPAMGNGCRPGARFGSGITNQITTLLASLYFLFLLFCLLCFVSGLTIRKGSHSA